MKKRTVILTIVLSISLLFCGCVGEKNEPQITVVNDFEISDETLFSLHLREETPWTEDEFPSRLGYDQQREIIVVTKLSSESYYWKEADDGFLDNNAVAYTRSVCRVDRILKKGNPEDQGYELNVGDEITVFEAYGITPDGGIVASYQSYYSYNTPSPIMQIGEQYVMFFNSVHQSLCEQYGIPSFTYSHMYYDSETCEFYDNDPITGRVNVSFEEGRAWISPEILDGLTLFTEVVEFDKTAYERALRILEAEKTLDYKYVDVYHYKIKYLWETYGMEVTE